MLKYKRFMAKKFLRISMITAIIVAIITAGYLVIESLIPVNSKLINKYNQQLQLLIEDFENLSSFENATSTVDKDLTIVTFSEKGCAMQCFFDKDGRYINYTLQDNRISNNFAASLLLIFFSFSCILLFMTVLEVILYIPIIVNDVYKKLKSRKRFYISEGS